MLLGYLVTRDTQLKPRHGGFVVLDNDPMGWFGNYPKKKKRADSVLGILYNPDGLSKIEALARNSEWDRVLSHSCSFTMRSQ